jgi:hypothetical protein
MTGRPRKIAPVPSGSPPERPRSRRTRRGLAGNVRATLGALPLTDADAAVGALALRYAEVLDVATSAEVASVEHVKAMAEIGPKLLATLAALCATPAARARDVPAAPAGSRLAALRDEVVA